MRSKTAESIFALCYRIYFQEITMTIRHLKIFLAVAESGSMSAAAKSLYITQPSVSQAVRELEEHYQIRLFERLNHRLYITDEGRRLFDEARPIVQNFDMLETNMTRLQGRHRLRIGVSMTVGTCVLPRLRQDLSSSLTGQDLYFYSGNTHTIEDKLLRSELDFGIVEGIVHAQDLVSIPIIDDFLVLCCSNDHPLAARPVLYPRDLTGVDFAIREEGSGTRALFVNYLKTQHIDMRISLEATSPETIRAMVKTSRMMTVMSVRLLEEDIRNRTIHVFKSTGHSWDRTFKLVHHKNKKLGQDFTRIHEALSRYKTPDFLDQISPAVFHE